jgi:hypothetical protein
MNEYLVITWTDSVPAGDGLAEAALIRVVNCSPPGRCTTPRNWTRVRLRPTW